MLAINSVTLLENPKTGDAYKATIPTDETMGNQQATREEIGWLAGIIDGEGYLGFNPGSKGLYMPCLHISNTDETIVLKCQAIFRKLGVNPYIRATKANKTVRKDQFRCQIKHMDKMKLILDAVYDYLTGNKQQRASLILEFIDLRQKDKWQWTPPNNSTNQGGPKKPYSEREYQIFNDCRAFQKRGASETTRGAQRLTSEIWKIMESRQLGVAKI
jgi:hypothetical protein